MPKFRVKKQPTVREVLENLGMSAEEIDEAEASGTDGLLAIDSVALPERGKFTIEEVARKVGTDIEVVRAFWRASGFVDFDQDEPAFSKRDVSILKSLVGLTSEGLLDDDLALQVARVVGLSMAQVATAVVDAAEPQQGERRDGPDDGPADGSLAVSAGELLPFMADVIDYSFRRHLRAATRRRILLASAVGGRGEVVGFADLVRFTEISGRLEDHELARLVGWFDQIVNSVVVRHQGRVVKMIGDAAMFSAVEPVQAASIALELSETVANEPRLSGLRVGMARGPVVARDGDLYGPVVNRASRLVAIGRAGAINVDQELRDALRSDDRFALRSLGLQPLRHIGEVRVYRLRPNNAGPNTQPG